MVIVDWKAMLRVPARSVLALRLQTRVYLWLAVEAGGAFNAGTAPQPDQVEMVYWFATNGGGTARFQYDDGQHQSGQDYLGNLVHEIASRKDQVWPLTSHRQRCQFCNYRSLCERGVTAGLLEDLDREMEAEVLEIDFEQIAEVAF
jgi:hypothetical protein